MYKHVPNDLSFLVDAIMKALQKLRWWGNMLKYTPIISWLKMFSTESMFSVLEYQLQSPAKKPNSSCSLEKGAMLCTIDVIRHYPYILHN